MRRWKDVTAYQGGPGVELPRTWRHPGKGLDLIVTKLPDREGLFMRASTIGIVEPVKLRAVNIKTAWQEAEYKVESHLHRLRRELRGPRRKKKVQ